jgi:glutamyl-tRNA reductase
MAQQIVLIGVDYRRAPLEVREELSFTREQALELLPQLIHESGAREALLLATCNRTEIYLASAEEATAACVLETLKRVRRGARALHEDCLRFMESGDRVAGHLFRVASGIDSQILGDTHIVTQVKQAHSIAAEAGTLGPVLDRTVTESLRAAKRARRETEIGKGAASVGAAVLRSVRHAFPDPSRVRALVLGGGEAGRDIASHLSKVRMTSLAFAARNRDQADQMAREYHGSAMDWDQVQSRFCVTDVLVTATSARLAFLDRSAVERLTAKRDQPLLMVDAGIPRNVDPAVAELPYVRLLNLDSLVQEQELALAARRREVPCVEAILAQELDRWRRWWQRRSSGHATPAMERPREAPLTGDLAGVGL